MDFFSFYRPFENENFISQCNVPWLKMACQWKDEYVIYRLGGPYGINLRQRAAFSSPKSEFFTVRIFPQPVNSLPLQSLFSSWVGGILQFCDLISSRNSSDTLPSASPPLILWKRRKKSLSVLNKKQKKE